MKIFVFILLFFLSTSLFSQISESALIQQVALEEVEGENILDDLLEHNLAPLFTHAPPQQVLGFIGDKYRRMRVRFISVIRNPEDPSEYLVFGKTKVSNNVCDFQGSIRLQRAYRLNSLEFPDSIQGILHGTYRFYEDPGQAHTGIFEGQWVNSWKQGPEGDIRYNDLMMIADGYTNNAFVGAWTGYRPGSKPKTANWGDYRIPFSGPLDQGAGEFAPAEEFYDLGWRSYHEARFGSREQMEAAQAEESREWWKED